ncbi:MAG: caspase family protein [Candidatus Hodarchaeota archaeon]
MSELIYKALLVGNSIFEKDPHNLPTLKGPPNDLKILEEALVDKDIGLYDPENVETLQDGTRNEITEKLEKFFKNAKRDDQLLFYYSGHGRLDNLNNLYLCARDTQTDLLISTGISDQVINSLIQQSSSSRNVIILDCCHSGRFKGLDLPRNLKGEGRFVLTSSRARGLSIDASDADGPSAFTRHLVDALHSGEVDANVDGFVSINEVYDYILPRLKDETKQIPQRHLDQTIAEVALGRSGRPEPVPKKETSPGKAILNVSETNIEIKNVKQGEKLPEEVVDVFNEGSGKLDWTVECSDDWIEVEEHKGYFKIKLNPNPGNNRGRIYVRDKGKGGSKTVRVFVQMEEEEEKPKLELSESSIDFGDVNVHGKATKTLRLINTGGGELKPKVAKTPNWLECELHGEILQVNLDTSKSGDLKGNVIIESEGGNVTVPIKASLQAGAVLDVSPTRANFGNVQEGTKKIIQISVRNAGGDKLEWDFNKRGDFFQVSQTKNGLSLTLDAEPGNHHGAVLINSNGGEATVDVRAKVLGDEVSPGKWQIDMNAYGLIGSRMIVTLLPNGQLSGQQTVMGIACNLQGTWVYDRGFKILTLQVAASVGGLFGTDVVTIQITQGSAGLFYGQDSLLRQYTLKRIG